MSQVTGEMGKSSDDAMTPCLAIARPDSSTSFFFINK